jgi:hypothetical protein
LDLKTKGSRRDTLKVLAVLPLTPLFSPGSSADSPLYFSCGEDNDLYRAATGSGIACVREEQPDEILRRAPDGSGVLILADGYPDRPTNINSELFQLATHKRLRLYIEFPVSLPGLEVGSPRGLALGRDYNVLERAVIVSRAFAPALQPMRILSLHDCRYVAVSASNPDLVLARVAGFDSAVYGLPSTGLQPVLFKHPNADVLVATTKLSGFVEGRYSPAEAWPYVWQRVLNWLSPHQRFPPMHWSPAVNPMFGRKTALPEGAEMDAFRRGIEWYSRGKLFIDSSWDHIAYQHAKTPGVNLDPSPAWPLGNGRDGVLEGFSSKIEWNGKQPVGWNRRADCAGEVSMAMALAGHLENKRGQSQLAANLNDFTYFNSALASGPRNDPKSPSFGLIGWRVPDSPGLYFADDNARSMLGTMVAAALLDSNRWNERVLRCLLGNLRTTGTLGFRHNALREEELQKWGWRHFWDEKYVNFRPHYEAYPWACFLRAYETTHYAMFLKRTYTAIRMTMAAYPNDWRWDNGFQQERARMLLPLAWLIRIQDKPEHRLWLKQIARDLLRFQVASGAIQEELGPPGKSGLGPPESNNQYGTSEAPLIQRNGDPVCDLLYTCNFAFLGLHEAAAATDDPFYREAENKLARFLTRAQIRSGAHPEFNGGWYRGFDFERWDYWASNADSGWGPWSIETGWTQSWICSVLAMRRMNISLWELTGRCDLGAHLKTLLPVMFGS